MKISDLQIAKNNAVYSSQLTQHRITENKVTTQSQGTTDQAVFGGSLVSSDNDYTKHDAILKQWNKEGSFNLYDVLSGGKVNPQNPNPSADELEAFEKKLQENGISADIDWSDFEFDLKGIGFSTDNPTFYLKPEDFNKKADYLASQYAAMKDKIKNNFSGEEYTKQLDKLDSLYKSALDEIATGYSEIVGGFLEQNGLSGEKEKIYQSVIDGVNNKSKEYEDYLSKNPDFAKLKGTKDEWLLQDDEYVASLLRGKDVQTDAIKTEKSNDYTLNDLNVLGTYVSELTKWENTAIKMDEERIGLDFAMLSMKTEDLRKNGGISSSLDSTLHKMLNGFMENSLNRLDEKLSELRNKGAALGDEKGYAKLNRQAIWDVYNKTMEHYRTSGDMMDSFVYGAKYAANKSLSKINDGTYRHINNASYWTQFFDKSKNNNNSYNSDISTYEKYAMGLNDFKKSLQQGGARLHINTISSSLYSTLSISNFLNERA